MPIITHCSIFRYRALLKVLNPGQGACTALHPFPCPTWHPSPQAAPCALCMPFVVQSMDADASSPWCTAKGVRWVPSAVLLCICPWGHLGLQPVPAGLPAWIMAVPTAQASLKHRLCMGVSECLQIVHLFFRNNFFFFFFLIVLLQD